MWNGQSIMDVLSVVAAVGLFLAAGFVLLSCRRVVRTRQALVIRSRSTGSVRAIVMGPGRAVVLPLVEESEILDTGWQPLTMFLEDLATSDCLAVTAQVEVLFAFHGVLPASADLDQVLPVLKDSKRLVKATVQYVLRSMLGEISIAQTLSASGRRARLERQLYHTVAAELKAFGLAVLSLHLVLQPTRAMLEAQQAARSRAAILAVLAQTLDPTNRELLQQAISWELIETHYPKNAQVLVTHNTRPTHATTSNNDHAWLINN